MTSRIAFHSIFSVAFLVLATISSARADSSHARIIRLSYVQGDVRIAHNVSGDSLQSESGWERATLNIPIHHGDAVATDNGRAEIEFESGTVAFLAENTVLEFYDLSLEDGEFTTRLILRQGSASFSVRPGRGDYFSVTGGDFSVEANEKAYFRVNNYDDGSDVQVFQGHISVLSKGKTTPVWKGQSLSIRAANPDSVSVESAANKDEFDQWTSGRIDAGQAALTASQQYSGVYDYTSGFGDLYTFGGWYSVAGYGYCWRPYGVSFGWNPFQFGRWIFDPFLGNWVFIGGQPWGWLPYHYGSWVFQPGMGWVWTPTGAFPYAHGGTFGRGGRGTGVWKPVTATWVRSGSTVALVPTHPLDEKGKTPINIREGVFPISARGVSDRIQVNEGQNWKSFKNNSRDALPTESASTGAPVRVVRTMAAGESSPGTVLSTRRETGIEFDPAEHRFVNSGGASSNERGAVESRTTPSTGGERQSNAGNPGSRGSDLRRASEGNGRGTEQAGSRGTSVVAPRMTPPPAPPPASSGARAGSYSGAGSSYGGGGGRGSSAGGSSAGSSGGSSRSWGGGSSSSSSSAGSSHPSSSSSGSSAGGRPH